MTFWFALVCASCVPLLTSVHLHAVPPELLTVAERSEYRETATHAEVMELIERIAALGDHVRVSEMGRTLEGRAIPLMVIADPPIATPDEARASGKLIFFMLGNIHAGEVCGKEALLMLAREFAQNPGEPGEPKHPILEDLILIFAPIYNADGNDRMDPGNRPGQVGPDRMGTRPNAQGLDLNRDFIKLAAPESRALVRFLNEWDPHLSVDTHATNGSSHRYVLTYAEPTNPSGHRASIAFVRDELLPVVTQRLHERTGYDTFFYGNFNRDRTAWATYSHEPRFGGPYMGLRGQMSILSEAYAYAPYKDRVLATREFVREIMLFARERKHEIMVLHDQARKDVIEAGRDPQPHDVVGVRYRPAALNGLVMLKGYEEERDERGRARATDRPKDYPVVFLGRFEPTISVRRPFAYLLPPGCEDIVAKLHEHGVETESFTGIARVEEYTITQLRRAERAFQDRRLVTIEATAARRRYAAPEGSTLVRLAQPLGNLIVYLLEPMSDDGFVTWGLFDERVSEGAMYPIRRIALPEDME